MEDEEGGELQVAPKLFTSRPARLRELLKARPLCFFGETQQAGEEGGGGGGRRRRKRKRWGGPGLIATN